MPRVQDAIPSLDCRAWKGHSNPLLLSTLRFAPESREGLSRQQVGIVGGKLETDFESFFHVWPARGVERFVKEPGIASVAANCLDRELPFVGDGQREEVARLGEGFGDQLLIDTMVDDVEEAHVAARRANLSDDPGRRGAIR